MDLGHRGTWRCFYCFDPLYVVVNCAKCEFYIPIFIVVH
jgi:hypothetical protein